MLDLNDERWARLGGGYRIPVEVRPLLHRLEAGEDTKSAWSDLWKELYHQGDVGEASYAAVPHIVRICRQQGTLDWNPYALVATIELARDRDGGTNPEIPAWLQPDYSRAIESLGQLALEQLPAARDEELVRAVLGMLALIKGSRTYARILIEFTEDEVIELEQQAFGPGA